MLQLRLGRLDSASACSSTSGGFLGLLGVASNT